MGGRYRLSIWEPNLIVAYLPTDYQYADAKPRQQLAPAVMFGDQPHITIVPAAFAEWITGKELTNFSRMLSPIDFGSNNGCWADPN